MVHRLLITKAHTAPIRQRGIPRRCRRRPEALARQWARKGTDESQLELIFGPNGLHKHTISIQWRQFCLMNKISVGIFPIGYC